MNYQAVLIEPFNEGLHYYYMKGLVATRNYREALRYYDELNDIFLSELGTGLSKRFKQLYDIIIADHAKEESKDMEKSCVSFQVVINKTKASSVRMKFSSISMSCC